MNLHQDKDTFEELVTATSLELHIPPNIIEKDYYVTLQNLIDEHYFD